MQKSITRVVVVVAAAAALGSLGVSEAGTSGAATRVSQPAGYDTTIGALLWAQRYKASSPGAGQSAVVSPTGNTVFVTGYSTGATSGNDYATIAYSG